MFICKAQANSMLSQHLEVKQLLVDGRAVSLNRYRHILLKEENSGARCRRISEI